MIFYTTGPTVKPKPSDSKPCDCKNAIYGSIIGILAVFNLLQLFYIIWTRRKMTG